MSDASMLQCKVCGQPEYACQCTSISEEQHAQEVFTRLLQWPQHIGDYEINAFKEYLKKGCYKDKPVALLDIARKAAMCRRLDISKEVKP